MTGCCVGAGQMAIYARFEEPGVLGALNLELPFLFSSMARGGFLGGMLVCQRMGALPFGHHDINLPGDH